MKTFFKTVFLTLIIAALVGIFLFARNRREPEKPVVQKPVEEVKITFIEGWSTKDMASYLERQHIVASSTLQTTLKNFDTSKYPISNRRPKGVSLEGYLFPDTYMVYNKASSTPSEIAEGIIAKALDNFEKKYASLPEPTGEAKTLTPHEIIILASILEKETGRSAATPEQRKALLEERKIVAGIFYNRLRVGMPLQSDATVNYVTGKNTPQPSYDDLDIDSPYNTYKYKGLPPGPISNPSLSALQAAINPTPTDYLYFLHRQDTGQAVYAKTFEEHVRNKAKYLQ